MIHSPYSLPPVRSRREELAQAEAQFVAAVGAAELAIKEGRLQDAATQLNSLQAQRPRDARVYVAGWSLARAANNAAAALESARRAVELAPMAALAHYCLAEAREATGDATGARESIEQALVLAPENLLYRETAVNLTTRAGEYAAAEQHLRAAYAQKASLPGIKTMLGHNLRMQQRYDEADEWFSAGLVSNPEDAGAHYGLAMTAYHRDQLPDALRHIEQALLRKPDDENYRYMRSIFAGSPAERQPEALTRELFDRYAARFDQHLVGALKYRVPQRIAALIEARYPNRQLNILDLGCGTGLLGAVLGRIDGFFVGVDLSAAMIAEAAKHGVYARFHQVNLLDALEATDANEYEVIVAADVFIYVGSVDAPLANAYKVLRPGGWLYFSCEHAAEDGPPFVLEKSMRYAHNPAHVKRLLETIGFVDFVFEDIDLRTENGVPTRGFLVSARKP